MKKKKLQVNAVLDSDLEQLLQNTNQYESIIAGQVKCKNCNSVITIQNIGIIVPVVKKGENLSFDFYCERIDCTNKYQRENGEF